jgi:hypothetical protein
VGVIRFSSLWLEKNKVLVIESEMQWGLRFYGWKNACLPVFLR